MKQYYMHLKEYSKYQEKILKKLYGKTTKANQRFSDIVNLVRPLTKEDKEIIFKTYPSKISKELLKSLD